MKLLLVLISTFLLTCAGLKIEKVSTYKAVRDQNKDEKTGLTTETVNNGKEKVFKIDDFEDADKKNHLGLDWYTWTDQGNGGGSTMKLVTKNEMFAAEGDSSKVGLKFTYKLEKKNWEHRPFVGLGSFVIRGTKDFDVTPYKGLRYSYKGAGHSVKTETSDIKDHDYHVVLMKPTTEWTTVEIPWDKFRQEGWGKYHKFNKKNVKKFSVQISGTDGEVGELSLDNIEYYTVPKIVKVVKHDLEALPLDEPTLDIGDISIASPLQAKAMKYLDKGVNVSNWIEADGYSYSMMYDEKDVKLMSELGFKSLRLPINIDFFLKNRTSYFTTQDNPKFMSDLFMIIDKFA